VKGEVGRGCRCNKDGKRRCKDAVEHGDYPLFDRTIEIKRKTRGAMVGACLAIPNYLFNL